MKARPVARKKFCAAVSDRHTTSGVDSRHAHGVEDTPSVKVPYGAGSRARERAAAVRLRSGTKKDTKVVIA